MRGDPPVDIAVIIEPDKIREICVEDGRKADLFATERIEFSLDTPPIAAPTRYRLCRYLGEVDIGGRARHFFIHPNAYVRNHIDTLDSMFGSHVTAHLLAKSE